MKMNYFCKSGLLACLIAAGLVAQSRAVDLAASAGVMAEVEAMSVSAKASLAKAALKGDTDAIAEAKKRSDAIDAAVAAARDAYSKLEIDVKNGDLDAAGTAEDDLASSLVRVKDALMGAIPEAVASQTKSSTSSNVSGGKPGNPDNPPNIYQVPWKSEGIKAYYEGLFGEFWNASAFGHGQGFGDHDATPE